MTPQKSHGDQDINLFLNQLISGSEVAWREFIHKYNKLIMGVVYHFGSNLEADDIAQKVYLKCVQDDYFVLRNFKEGSWISFFVYIKKIAKYIVLAERKKQIKDAEKKSEIVDWENQIISKQKPFELDLEEVEFTASWQVALMKLEVRQREVILHLLSGYSTKEIARIMKSPQNTVLSWSKRAKANLKKILEKDAVLQ